MKTLANPRTKNHGLAKDYFENKISFTIDPITLNEVLRQHDPVVIIDVRKAEDYEQSHIPGALNLPETRWDSNLEENLEKDRLHIVYCYNATCHLGAHAALAMSGKGYTVMELVGGFAAWNDNHFQTEVASQSFPKTPELASLVKTKTDQNPSVETLLKQEKQDAEMQGNIGGG